MLKLLVGVLENEPAVEQLQVSLECIYNVVYDLKECPHEVGLLIESISKYLRQFLDFAKYPDTVVWEAMLIVCSFTNLSNSFIIDFVEQGGVPLLMDMLRRADPGMLESVIVSIGNISSLDRRFAGMFLEEGASSVLVSLLHSGSEHQIWHKQLSWTTGMMTQHYLKQLNTVFYETLQIFSKLKDFRDTEADIDILWGCMHLTSGEDEALAVFAKSDLMQFVLNKLKQSSVKTCPAVLKAIGNLLSGPTTVSQPLLDLGVAELLIQYLSLPCEPLVSEALFSLSNIATESAQCAMRVFKHSVVPHAVRGLWSKYKPLAKEACFYLLNLAQRLPVDTVERLQTEFNVFSLASHQLESLELEVLCNFLMALWTLLRRSAEGYQINALLNSLEVAGWPEALERVQLYDNEEVYSVSSVILKEFFDGEETFEFS
jgi:hypothetical protein